MLRKAKSPIALIMALILCISLFSGIVLAEGFNDTSAEIWNSIAESIDDSAGYEVVLPKENVVFIDENLAGAYSEGDPIELEYYTSLEADPVYYALTYGENAFGDVAEMRTYIDTTLDAANAGKDYTIVLAWGTHDAADFYAASEALTGSTITVLGPRAGVAPIDDAFDVNPDRSADSGSEALLTGTVNLAVNKDFTIIFDGVALGDNAQFAQEASDEMTRFTLKLNNVYSVASGIAGTFNDDWSVATAGTDHVFLKLLGNDTMKLLRDVTIENSYFEFTRLSNTSWIEDYTLKNSYFKGLADQSTFYNSVNTGNPCLDGTYDSKATITFEGTRFENIANYWANGEVFTKSALLRTELRDDGNADRVANNAKRGEGGYLITVNNCDFIDMVPGDDNNGDLNFFRPQGFAGGVMKILFTNNTFSVKEGVAWAGVKGGRQYVLNPFSTKLGLSYNIDWTIENNKFIGGVVPFSYNEASMGDKFVNVDISKNYYADHDGNLTSPAGGYGAIYTGQYLDEAMTEFSGDYLLTGVTGAGGLDAAAVDITDAANGIFTGTATIATIDAAAVVGAAFADASIPAKVYADEACETELTSYENLVDGSTIYVKGVKGANTIIYAVSVAGPYAAIRGEADENGVYSLKDKDNTVFIDPSAANKGYTDGQTVEYLYGDSEENPTWGDGKKYSLVYGQTLRTNLNSYFQTVVEATNGVSQTAILAPSSTAYTFTSGGGNKMQNKTFTILGPQAGKTPVNNPKKGYGGSAPWTVANNRSANSATEAVFSSLGLNNQNNGYYVIDGVAFNNYQVQMWSSHNYKNMVTSLTLKNVYWSMTSGKSILYTNRADTASDYTNCVRKVNIYDTFVNYTGITSFTGNTNVHADDLIFDGVYIKMPEGLSLSNAGSSDYIWHSFLSHLSDDGDGKSILSVTNSRFENFPMRGVFSSRNDAYLSDQRPAGSAVYHFDNNDFINIGYNSTSELPTVVRILAKAANIYDVTFTNNYCENKTDKKVKALDVYRSVTHTMALYNSDISNNAFVGYKVAPQYENSFYDRNATIDLTYNYFGSANGSLLTPTAIGGVFNGTYLDKNLSVHTDDLMVGVPSKLQSGSVVGYNTYAISGKLPDGASLTVADFTTKAGVTTALYSDAACANAIESITDAGTYYLKVTKNGYGKTYTVTLLPDADLYDGDKVFFDPEVAGMATGAQVARTLDGKKYLFTVGTNVFGALNATNFPADGNGISHAYFFAKSYAGFTVPTNFAIYGAKAGINPNIESADANGALDLSQPNPERENEAAETVVTGIISLPVSSTNITIDGFTLKGAAKFQPSGSSSTTAEMHATIKNCRTSTAADAYNSKPNSALFHMYSGGYKYLDVIDNRFVDVQFGNNASATFVIRSWMGTASGNYIQTTGQKGTSGEEQYAFWLFGEYTDSNTTDHGYNATITANHIVGRLTEAVDPKNYTNYAVTITDNTLEHAFKGVSFITVRVDSKNMSKAKINISGNDVINPNNLSGVGFIYLTQATNEEGMTGYDKANVAITGNNIAMGNNFASVFTDDGNKKADTLIITATGNAITGVDKATGSPTALFDKLATAKHFDLGSTEEGNATTVGGVAVDVIPTDAAFDVPASAIDTANKEITVAVKDTDSAFNLLATAGANVAVLDEEGNPTAMSANLAAANGVREYKVAIVSYDGTYDPANVYTVKVVKGLATVELDIEKTIASKEDGKETWKTYWEANIDVIEEFGATIASSDFKVTDYGMFYGNDEEELGKLVADNAYETVYAAKHSYAENAEGLEKVYKNYSFRFTGIAEGKYRYGKFYVTYELNGETITTVSDIKELYTGVIAE